jgi:hypothetical protein
MRISRKRDCVLILFHVGQRVADLRFAAEISDLVRFPDGEPDDPEERSNRLMEFGHLLELR